MYLTTREIAILTYLFLIFLIIVFNSVLRKEFLIVIKILFSKNILIIFLIIVIYNFLILTKLFEPKMYNKFFIKDIIIWNVFNVFKYIMNFNVGRKYKKNWISTIKEEIKIIKVIEFIIMNFTFNIILELIIIPLIFILESSLFLSNKNEKNYKIILKCLQIIDLFIILMTVNVVINTKDINILANVFSFLIPIIYTVLFLPIGYIIGLYARYEHLINRYNFTNTKVKNKYIILIIKTCKFSIRKVQFFLDTYDINVENIKEEDIKGSIEEVNEKYKSQKYYLK